MLSKLNVFSGQFSYFLAQNGSTHGFVFMHFRHQFSMKTGSEIKQKTALDVTSSPALLIGLVMLLHLCDSLTSQLRLNGHVKLFGIQFSLYTQTFGTFRHGN